MQYYTVCLIKVRQKLHTGMVGFCLFVLVLDGVHFKDLSGVANSEGSSVNKENIPRRK